MNVGVVEVDHLTEWSELQWWVHLGWVLVLPALVALAAVVAAVLGGWVMERVGERRAARDVGELLATVCAVVGAVAAALAGLWVALGIYGQSAYSLLRHSTSWNRSLLWVVVIVGVWIAIGAFILGSSPDNETDVWLLAVAAAVVVIPIVIAFVADALHRIAAWIPMAFGMFMLLLLGVIIFFVDEALK